MIRHGSLPFYQAMLIGMSPSPESTICCIIFGGVATLWHMVYTSLNFGTIAPDAYGGYLGLLYTNTIVGPLQTLLNNTLFNSAGGLVLWGLIGLVVFELINFVITFGRLYHEADGKMSFSREARTIRSKLKADVIYRFLWRIFIAILTLGILAAMRPLFHYALSADRALVTTKLSTTTFVPIVCSCLIWALALHIIIVFLRFYLLRIRLRDNNNLTI